jgi:hypothetical protein
MVHRRHQEKGFLKGDVEKIIMEVEVEIEMEKAVLRIRD